LRVSPATSLTYADLLIPISHFPGPFCAAGNGEPRSLLNTSLQPAGQVSRRTDGRNGQKDITLHRTLNDRLSWFHLDLNNHQTQVYGYNRITPEAGLQIFMPDLDEIPKNWFFEIGNFEYDLRDTPTWCTVAQAVVGALILASRTSFCSWQILSCATWLEQSRLIQFALKLSF
jgi:hypothetical protein